MDGLYKQQLLEHFKHPHNRGHLESAQCLSRGRNPSCGDEVEVGVFFEDKQFSHARFEGRGCSVCIASASMMTKAVEGLNQVEVKNLCFEVKEWFLNGHARAGGEMPDPLSALAVVHGYPSRQRCALLCWEALENALSEH